jgi:hypothetical protein
LIGRIQRDGYPVETYQFPFLADERKVHSTLLERLTGIVDLRGDREVFMTYSSFNHPVDSALIWEYGPEAQLLAVGSTAGDPDPKFGPLNWDEFSRDLIVACDKTHKLASLKPITLPPARSERVDSLGLPARFGNLDP